MKLGFDQVFRPKYQFVGNMGTEEHVKTALQGYNQQNGNGNSIGQTTCFLQQISCKMKTKSEGKPIV